MTDYTAHPPLDPKGGRYECPARPSSDRSQPLLDEAEWEALTTSPQPNRAATNFRTEIQVCQGAEYCIEGYTMISLVNHDDPVDAIHNLVVAGRAYHRERCVIEYWRGETEFEPSGLRRRVFRYVMDLYKSGRAVLYQVKYGDEYSYRMEIRST